MLVLVSVLLAAAPSQLTLEVKPADTIIFVDGKKVGDASKPRTLKLKAGSHEVKLTHSGDSHSDEIVIKAGEKLTWRFEFEEDRKPSKQPTVDEEKAEESGSPP
jgi:hypothetical protein